MKYKYIGLAGAVGLAIAGLAAVVITADSSFERHAPAPSAPSGTAAFVGKPSAPDGGAEEAPVIQAATGDFSMTLPENWYLERNDTTGLAVYVDYDPDHADASPPSCKIEAVEFALPQGADLDAWIEGHLASDPTASVVKTAERTIAVGGKSAIEWQGTINDLPTTLGYAVIGTKVLEVAPSVLKDQGDVDRAACDAALETFLSNITW